MSKILLIRCKSEKYARPYGSPPLGLLYLSAVLKQRGHDVRIIDARAQALSGGDIVRRFRQWMPDMVGVSNFSTEARFLKEITQEIKAVAPLCPIIVGGPHACACSEEVIRDPHVDYLVIGEGERTFPELVAVLEGGGDASLVKGIAYRTGGMIQKTPPRELIEDLDELPFPDFDAVDLTLYYRLPRFMPFVPKNGTPYLPIMSSRGCPFNCIYCHNIFGKKFRVRSAENVFREMELAHNKYGVLDFEFLDDCFNLNRARALKLCELIISSGVDWDLYFPNGLRGDMLDKELIRKMHAAGTKVICFAPETGSPRLQKVIRKFVHLERLQAMISVAAGLKIHTHGFFMLGFRGETEDDLRLTLDFIKKTRLHTADFFIVNMFPNTELYDSVLASGGVAPETFEECDYHDAVFNLSELSSKALVGWQRRLFLRFYLDPLRVFRILFCSMVIKKRHLFYYFMVFFNRVVLRRRES